MESHETGCGGMTKVREGFFPPKKNEVVNLQRFLFSPRKLGEVNYTDLEALFDFIIECMLANGAFFLTRSRKKKTYLGKISN